MSAESSSEMFAALYLQIIGKKRKRKNLDLHTILSKLKRTKGNSKMSFRYYAQKRINLTVNPVVNMGKEWQSLTTLEKAPWCSYQCYLRHLIKEHIPMSPHHFLQYSDRRYMQNRLREHISMSPPHFLWYSFHQEYTYTPFTSMATIHQLYVQHRLREHIQMSPHQFLQCSLDYSMLY